MSGKRGEVLFFRERKWRHYLKKNDQHGGAEVDGRGGKGGFATDGRSYQAYKLRVKTTKGKWQKSGGGEERFCVTPKKKTISRRKVLTYSNRQDQSTSRKKFRQNSGEGEKVRTAPLIAPLPNTAAKMERREPLEEGTTPTRYTQCNDNA